MRSFPSRIALKSVLRRASLQSFHPVARSATSWRSPPLMLLTWRWSSQVCATSAIRLPVSPRDIMLNKRRAIVPHPTRTIARDLSRCGLYSDQILAKPGQGALPGILGSIALVDFRAGIVYKGMFRAGVDHQFVRHSIGLQPILKGLDAGQRAVFVPDDIKNRRLRFCKCFWTGHTAAIKGCYCAHIRVIRARVQRQGTAHAEADHANLFGVHVVLIAQVSNRCIDLRHSASPIKLHSRFLRVVGFANDLAMIQVGCERYIALIGKAVGEVLHMRIKSPPFLNNHQTGFRVLLGGAGQIAWSLSSIYRKL